MKLTPTPANEKYAERLKATIELEIEKGTFDYAQHFPNSKRARRLSRIPGSTVKVSEQLITWLDSREGEIEVETYSEYELDIKKHLKPSFGDYPLPELTKSIVKGWAGSVGLSLKRINNILIPLRSMYDDALNQDPPLIDRNPLASLSLKRVRTVKAIDEIDPFTRAEMASIYKACDTEEDKDFVEFWVWTGLRLQEIIALEARDINLVRRTIRIARAIREGRVKSPKTRAGVREVKLLEPAFQAIKRQLARMDGKLGPVWRNPRTGEPWAGDGAIRKTFWIPLLSRATVRYRPAKQVRHTYASWMLSAYENPLWVARQMGHRDWGQIIRTYGRWIPDIDPLAGTRAVTSLYGNIRASYDEKPNEISA